MSRVTQKKGDLAVSRAIFYFTELGYDVSIPVTESASYDLVVDDGSLHRVQVKYSSVDQLDLRRVHSNAKGYVVSSYPEEAFDWLYVYWKGLDVLLTQQPKSDYLSFGKSANGAVSGLENQ